MIIQLHKWHHSGLAPIYTYMYKYGKDAEIGEIRCWIAKCVHLVFYCFWVFFLSFSRLMTSRGKFGKLFLLGSPATPMTSSHCWRRRPISSPSAPCFTRTRSTARRQENSRTRFTRWGTKKVIKANPQSLLGFKISLLFHLADSFASQRCRWDLNPLIFAAFAPTGWGYLPGIPGVPRALADLPHVVHRDCQFHWRRRRSLGLLSCVSALLNWHQPPAHTRTQSSSPQLLLCHWKTKPPFEALVTNYHASLIIFPPGRRIVDQGRASFVPEGLFRFFRGKSWIEYCCLLKYWTMS